MDQQSEAAPWPDALTLNATSQAIARLEIELPTLLHPAWQERVFGAEFGSFFEVDDDNFLLAKFSEYLFNLHSLPLLLPDEVNGIWLDRLRGGAHAMSAVVSRLEEAILDQRILQTVARVEVDALVQQVGLNRYYEAFNKPSPPVRFPASAVPCAAMAAQLLTACCRLQDGPAGHLELMLAPPAAEHRFDYSEDFCAAFLATAYAEQIWEEQT